MPDESALLKTTHTTAGQTLAELSEESPVLFVLLRHEGCTFCRNAMSDIARLRPRIEEIGTRIVLGHMGTPAEFVGFAEKYGLTDIDSVSDPDRTLYKGLGLRRGSLWQLLGPRVWLAGLRSTLSGHLPGIIRGDPWQLPGAFLLHKGKVVKGHAYRNAGDRPDYFALATV
ncbi:MAG: redoxin domain-containing protein [Verrucomicrobiales bacterium]|nr:redoxin domain-containing protein [Verrucomicrobiales bacterium]MCP5559030.1 redoxin domain-containing protein [Verrucomicrobiaceae bacterium]